MRLVDKTLGFGAQLESSCAELLSKAASAALGRWCCWTYCALKNDTPEYDKYDANIIHIYMVDTYILTRIVVILFVKEPT